MAIANYIMSQRPIVPSIDLNVAQNAINKIQEGSEKALEIESELKTAVASLDLHASEDAFKQQLVNEIEIAADNNASVPYYSLPQLIKAKGNIFSNPGLTGRLRANQAYKEFQAQVDANRDINDNVKRYTKAMNPYHYEDKVDENGNVIGGSEWKPIFAPVKSMDFNDVLKIAAQYASSERGGGQSFTYLDENGRPTSNPTNNYGVYSTTTQSWERLTPEKLRQGIYAAMNANPEFAASLEQDYKVYNWMYGNGETTGNPIVDDKGGKKTFNEYVSDMINPFLIAKSYYNTTSSVQFNNASIKAINDAALKRQKRTISNPNFKQDPYTTTSHLYEVTDNSAQKAISIVNTTGNGIKKLISSLDENVNTKGIDIVSPDDLKNLLDKSNISDAQKQEIIAGFEQQYIANFDEFEKYKKLLSQNTKEAAAYFATQSLLSGTEISNTALQSNDYLKSYSDDINKMISTMYDGYENVSYATRDREQRNRLIEALGGEANLDALGYKLSEVNGRYVISLPKESSAQLYNFINAAGDAYSESSIGHRIGQWARREFLGGGDGFYKSDNDGNFHSLQVQNIFSNIGNVVRRPINWIDDIDEQGFYGSGLGFGAGRFMDVNYAARNGWGDVATTFTKSIRNSLRTAGVLNQDPATYAEETFGVFMDRLNRDAKTLASADKKHITTLGSAELPEIQNARQMAMSSIDTGERNRYEGLIKDYYAIIDNLTTTSSLMDAIVYKFDENGVKTPVKTDTKRLIANALNNPDNIKTYSPIYNHWEGRVDTQVAITFKGENENPIDGGKTPLFFTTSKLMNSEELAKINGSDEFRAGSQLYRNGVTNQNTTVGVYNFDGKYKNIYITPIEKDAMGESYREIRNGNDELIDKISEDDAMDVLINYNRLRDAAINHNATEEQKQSAVLQFINDDAIRALYGDEILANMIKIMFGYDIQ